MVRIVVEGSEDKNFINQLVSIRLGNSLNEFEFIETGTNPASLSEVVINTINTKTVNLEEPTIFIFDADKNLNKYFDKLKLSFNRIKRKDVFFFPDNVNQGNLESLLRSILPHKYKRLLEPCIDSFATCVNDLNMEEYSISEKNKFFMYTEVLSGKSGKGTSRNYNPKYFDMKSKKLNAIVDFLKPFLKS